MNSSTVSLEESPGSNFQGSGLKRDIIVFINRIRSGHYNLNSSLAHVHFIDFSRCECGNDFQDLNNVIWQYPQFKEERRLLIKNMMKNKQIPPFDVNSYLIEPNKKIMSIIFE